MTLVKTDIPLPFFIWCGDCGISRAVFSRSTFQSIRLIAFSGHCIAQLPHPMQDVLSITAPDASI